MTDGPVPEAMPDGLSERHLLRRLGGLVILLGIVIVLVISLPGLGTLRHRFAGADWRLVVLIGLLKFGSCISNVVAFRDVFCPKMHWRFTYQLSMAEQGTNVLVPTGGAGGLALGAWALRQGGMSAEHLTRRSVTFFVLTSIPNFACAALLGPLLLIGVLSGKAPTVPTAVFSGLAWLFFVLAVALARFLHHVHPDESHRAWTRKVRTVLVLVGQGLDDVGWLIRDRRWRAILGACGYLFFDIAALVVAFAAFGHLSAVGTLVFAYVIGQLGGLIPLPAGIGGVDGGLIGALVLFGSPLSQATAADLAYRTFQLGVPAILGTIAFVQLRRTLSRSVAPAVECVHLAEEADAASHAQHH